jgi:hypothetical protein
MLHFVKGVNEKSWNFWNWQDWGKFTALLTGSDQSDAVFFRQKTGCRSEFLHPI